MSDIVAKLRHAYHLDTVQPEHPVLRAVREIERLRESEQKFMQLAAEARRDADALRRDGACPHIRSTAEGTHHCALAAASQPSAEPLAWRWKARLDDGRISNWMLTHSNPPPYAVALEPLYTTTPQPAPDALREAAQQALEWLVDEQQAADGDCGNPACKYCESDIRPRNRLIDALRAALEGDQ